MFKLKPLKRKMRSSKDFLIAKIVVFILFALYAFTLIFAMLWAFSASLKSQNEFYENINGLPREWLFSNYVTAFSSVQANGNNMFVMFWNSVWYSCGGAALGVFTSSVTAYVQDSVLKNENSTMKLNPKPAALVIKSKGVSIIPSAV